MGKSSSNTLNHTLCEVSCSSKDLFYRITSKDMGSNTCWPKNDLTRCGQELIFAALTLTAFLSRHPLLRCTGPTCPSPFALLSMCVNYYLLRTLAVVKTTAACVTWWSWRFLVIFTATAVSQTANDPPPPWCSKPRSISLSWALQLITATLPTDDQTLLIRASVNSDS